MGRKGSEGESEGPEKQLARLGALDEEGLKQRWRMLYGAEPPPRVSRSLLLQAIAYRLQEKTLGGLKPSTRRLLQRIATDAGAGRAVKPVSERRLKPGAVLLREWHGVTHQVTVLADGVRFRGTQYRSLSQVARLITGSRWSGPLFFGLRRAGKRLPAGNAITPSGPVFPGPDPLQLFPELLWQVGRDQTQIPDAFQVVELMPTLSLDAPKAYAPPAVVDNFVGVLHLVATSTERLA